MLTSSDSFVITFEVLNEKFSLKLVCDKQDVEKSWPLSGRQTRCVDLPAGEVYFVPSGADGTFHSAILTAQLQR